MLRVLVLWFTVAQLLPLHFAEAAPGFRSLRRCRALHKAPAASRRPPRAAASAVGPRRVETERTAARPAVPDYVERGERIDVLERQLRAGQNR